MPTLQSCTAIVLALLLTSLSASTIPLISNPSNLTLPPPTSASSLAFPPAPFRYQIPPYPECQMSILFSAYGRIIPRNDAIRTLLGAQVEIMRELARDPHHADLPVGRTRVFDYDGSVTVTIEPRPELNHAYLGLWLAGAMQAGVGIYGFVECEMQYVDERAIFGPGGFELGRGRVGIS